MKKRIFSLFLAAVLLLSGCAVEGDPKDTQASTVPSTAGTTEPVDYWQNVKDRVQQGTVYEPAEPLIEYDPDRKLLITLANQSINFFASGMKGFCIFLYKLFILRRLHFKSCAKTAAEKCGIGIITGISI